MSAYLILLLGVVAMIVGVLLCFRGGWFIAWLRGTAGLLFILSAVVLVIYGLDLRYYQVLNEEQPVARILIDRLDDQRWQVIVQEPDKPSRSIEVNGDEWQIDARVLRWPVTLQAIGFQPMYRLERMSGRYRSIRQEISSPRTAIDLSDSFVEGEWWGWIVNLSFQMDWLDAAYGSSAYHPLADGAVYEVKLTNSGLISRAVNDAAQNVLADWIKTTAIQEQEEE